MDENYCVMGYIFVTESGLPERHYFVNACVYAVDKEHAIDVVRALYQNAYNTDKVRWGNFPIVKNT